MRLKQVDCQARFHRKIHVLQHFDLVLIDHETRFPGYHADDIAALIEQRPATIARLNRGGDLQKARAITRSG